MQQSCPVIKCDTLIIGGGSAGAMAAVRAKEVGPTQKVAIFEKGEIKYSGSIPRGMDALNIVAKPGLTTPELYVESNTIACEGIMDEPVNYKLAERSYDLMQKLISWGVCFPVDEDGNHEYLQVHPKGRFAATMKEPNLKVILAKKLLESGVEVFNRTAAIRLLIKDGQVAGAIGMNVRTGEIIVCQAKSVIVSTGGTARFGLPNNGYLYGVYDFPGNTGDGYCLAYHAGAELSGFEYTMLTYIIKDINAPLLYITLTRGAHLLNAFGDRKDQEHPGLKLMLDEHQAGRGPLRIRMDHLSEQKISEIEDILFTTERPVQERFFQGRDVDFRKSEIELWPTECFLCGGHGLTGVRVNEHAEASIPGLYAAGDTALVARGHLSGAFVYGEIAAESACKRNANMERLKFDSGQVENVIRDRDSKLSRRSNPVTVEEFEYKLRRIINDYIVPPKNEYKLDRALWWLDRFKSELVDTVGVKDIHDLFKVYEVENIIQCALLSALASKERKESRWGLFHERSDYTEKNDQDWLKHIVLTRGDASDDVIISHREITRMEDN